MHTHKTQWPALLSNYLHNMPEPDLGQPVEHTNWRSLYQTIILVWFSLWCIFSISDIKFSTCAETLRETEIVNIELSETKKMQRTLAVLQTHVFDEKGMQHDISEAIILQGGEQGWLLEHKHRHNLCRYKPKRQETRTGGERKKEIIIQNNDHKSL